MKQSVVRSQGLSLQAFAHVFSTDVGQQFLVQYLKYQAVADKLLDCDEEMGQRLETIHGKQYWDIFQESMALQYATSEAVLEALKELHLQGLWGSDVNKIGYTPTSKLRELKVHVHIGRLQGAL